MRILHALTAVIFVTLALPASAASLSSNDQSYLTTAIQMQLGRYALATYEKQHGSGTAKAYAASIARKSARDARMLQQWAKRYGVAAPSGIMMQDKVHYEQLMGLHGAALDKRFARELRMTDQIDQYTHRDEMRSGRNAKLKSYSKTRYTEIQHELGKLSHM